MDVVSSILALAVNKLRRRNADHHTTGVRLEHAGEVIARNAGKNIQETHRRVTHRGTDFAVGRQRGVAATGLRPIVNGTVSCTGYQRDICYATKYLSAGASHIFDDKIRRTAIRVLTYSTFFGGKITFAHDASQAKLAGVAQRRVGITLTRPKKRFLHPNLAQDLVQPPQHLLRELR